MLLLLLTHRSAPLISLTLPFLNIQFMTSKGKDTSRSSLAKVRRFILLMEMSQVMVKRMLCYQPRLLWRFEDGDRADGGLRRIYAENGGLVVELYGKRADGTGKIVGSDLFVEDGMMGGDCCPSHFTRAHYKWNGKRFVLRGEPEVLPN